MSQATGCRGRAPTWPGLRKTVGIAALLGVPALASAAEFDYRLGLSAQYSDNITLVQDDPISERIVIPSAAFLYANDGDRLAIQAAGSLEHRSYLGNSFSSEFRTRMGLQADWSILPQALSWTFQDYLASLPIDPQNPARPDNIQTTNLLVTGPTWILRPWDRTRMQLEARYANTYAETTPEFDSNRISVAARGFHQTSPLSTWSWNVEIYEISTRDSVAAVDDYERRDLYGRYERSGSTWTLSADAGVTRVRPEGGGWNDEPLLQVEATWTPRATLSADASLSRRVSDAAFDIIRSSPDAGDFDLDYAIPSLQLDEPTAQLYLEDRAQLRLVNRGGGNTLRVNAYWRDQAYLESTLLDQSRWGAGMTYGRQIRPRVFVGGYVRAEQRRFDSVTRRDRDLEAGLEWTWRWLRNVSVSARVGQARRDSNVPGGDYTDNRATLSLSYRRR